MDERDSPVGDALAHLSDLPSPEEDGAARAALANTMVAPALTGSVEEILGREVLTYHSQIVFGSARAFEIFVLAPKAS